MLSYKVAGLMLAAAVTFSGPALAASKQADPIKMFDPDHDGTLDLAEVQQAASAMFAKLDPDKDGTLDARELRGRLSAKELAAADPDRDGTLTLKNTLPSWGSVSPPPILTMMERWTPRNCGRLPVSPCCDS
jgi:hypothetical protein